MNAFKKGASIAFIFISFLVLIYTVLSLFYHVSSVWWIKATNFPRVQVFILCILLLAAYLWMKSYRVKFLKFALAAVLFSATVQAWFLAPYLPVFPKELPSATEEPVNPETQVSLLIANVYMKNRNANALLNIIRQADADLVMLMETNAWWQKAMAPLARAYPYHVMHPLENTYGLLFFSRYPLINPEVRFLEKTDVPSVHTTVALPNKAHFKFHGVHPVPPVPIKKHPDNIGESGKELEVLARMITGETLPSLVAGDFNDVAWSRTSKLFKSGSKLKDIRTGRGLYNSFDATSVLMRWPLDHVYADPRFRVVQLERMDKFGSDHFPIFVRLSLEEAEEGRQVN